MESIYRKANWLIRMKNIGQWQYQNIETKTHGTQKNQNQQKPIVTQAP